MLYCVRYSCILLVEEREVVVTSVTLVFTIVEYTLMFLFLAIGAYYIYNMITTIEERKVYRAKLLKQLKDTKNDFIKKNEESKVQKILKEAGIPLTATRFTIYRIILIIFMFCYIPFYSIFLNGEINFYSLFIPVIFILITEPKIKFSPISLLFNFFIKNKKKQKILELFTLFDILKAELSTLSYNQEINIYTVLKDSLPLLEHIQGTMSRFLSLWKTNPEMATHVFYKEIPSESAKILGEILYKLDKASKKEALQIIEAEAKFFSFSYFESELQTSGKKRIAYYTFFFMSVLSIIFWTFSMLSSTTMLNMNF